MYIMARDKASYTRSNLAHSNRLQHILSVYICVYLSVCCWVCDLRLPRMQGKPCWMDAVSFPKAKTIAIFWASLNFCALGLHVSIAGPGLRGKWVGTECQSPGDLSMLHAVMCTSTQLCWNQQHWGSHHPHSVMRWTEVALWGYLPYTFTFIGCSWSSELAGNQEYCISALG